MTSALDTPTDAVALPENVTRLPEDTSQTTSPAITLGRTVKRPQGHRVAIDAVDPVADLASVLDEHRGVEAWWSPSTFRDDYRHGDHWLSSWVLGADIDYYDDKGEHACPPAEVRARIAERLPAMLATLAHLTPRGVRVVGLLDVAITDTETHACASRTFTVDVRTVLSELFADRDGLRIDGASYDRARLLYTPRSTVDGVRRTGEIVRVGGVLSTAQLSQRAPCVASPGAGGSDDRPRRSSTMASRGMPSASDVSRSGWDFREALRLIRDRASDAEIASRLRALSEKYREKSAQGEPVAEDYIGRTVANAREVHESSLRRAIVTAVYLDARPAFAGKQAWADLKLSLATVDGEVLPRAQVVVPSQGYESARPRFEAVCLDLDIVRLMRGEGDYARAALIGRELEVVVDGREIKWAARVR